MEPTTQNPRKKKWPLIVLAVVAVLAVATQFVVLGVSKLFTAQESVVRSEWEIDAGEVIGPVTSPAPSAADSSTSSLSTAHASARRTFTSSSGSA